MRSGALQKENLKILGIAVSAVSYSAFIVTVGGHSIGSALGLALLAGGFIGIPLGMAVAAGNTVHTVAQSIVNTADNTSASNQPVRR